MTPNHVITLIETLAKAAGLSPHTIGRYASGNGDFYSRLKRGHDLTTRRAGRVIQNLSDAWLPDLAWPSDIPRPAPSSPASDPQEAA